MLDRFQRLLDYNLESQPVSLLQEEVGTGLDGEAERGDREEKREAAATRRRRS